jgi:hypothetical protein
MTEAEPKEGRHAATTLSVHPARLADPDRVRAGEHGVDYLDADVLLLWQMVERRHTHRFSGCVKSAFAVLIGSA